MPVNNSGMDLTQKCRHFPNPAFMSMIKIMLRLELRIVALCPLTNPFYGRRGGEGALQISALILNTPYYHSVTCFDLELCLNGTWIVFWCVHVVLCLFWMPHSVTGWSLIYDCGISWSYSLVLFVLFISLLFVVFLLILNRSFTST